MPFIQVLSSLRGATIAVPSTVTDAEHLLHVVRSHRDICEHEKNLALKRLHHTLLYLQILRQEMEKAVNKLSAADDDIGKLRAAIRMTGLSGRVHPQHGTSTFLVNVDNVGSNQMHQIRVALRGKGVVLMGKNTMFEHLLPHTEIREIIIANKVVNPCRDRDPRQPCSTCSTSLLFTYGMSVVQIFDSGNAFSPSVFDIDEQELIDRFLSGIKTIAALSACEAQVPLTRVGVALTRQRVQEPDCMSLAMDYMFEGSEKVFAVAEVAPTETKAAEKVEEEE
ncbi:hypothetical protein C8J57DRAFT_1542509 [Mycena rebaudengoi]|nr:hypothetical protein C8J57DRAFT_1542509 [Mycena rebaudengoi]